MSELATLPQPGSSVGEGASGQPGRKALVAAIGDAAMIALAEQFGGTRLYVPARVAAGHPIAAAIGPESAEVLRVHVGAPVYLRVPLARELRATKYRAEGLSNGRIAARLGLTEQGVRALFKRLAARDPRAQGDGMAPQSAAKEAR